MNGTPPPIQSPSSPAKNSALAIWSLVLGILTLILSIFCIGALFALPAIICGHMALGRIKKSTGTLTGGGMAIAGLVTGYIGIVVSIILIPVMAAMVLPAIAKAKDRAQRVVCVSNLRMIDTATQQWAVDKGKQSTDTPTWDDLKPYLTNLPAVPPTCLAEGTYTLHPVGEHPTCSVTGHEWGTVQ